MDGTVRSICRPSQQQRILYNGRKRIHVIKFQSVVIPNGLIANFSGPYEGEKHDSGMLTESGFLTNLEHYTQIHKSRMCSIIKLSQVNTQK